MDEAELIRCSKQGDANAFNSLIEHYQKEALNLAARMLGNIHDAEDVCQDSWTAAWESIRRFKGGNFRSWILHIVANACRDEYRRRKKRVSISLNDLQFPEIADPKGDIALTNEMVIILQEALLQLSYEQRLAIILREYNGLNYDEIARVMKCSLGTVRSRLSRARISLRNLLRERGSF